MKKLICILLLIALVFTLCACRRKDEGNDKNNDNTSEGGNSNTGGGNSNTGGGNSNNGGQTENPFGNNGSGIETPIIPLD